MVEPDEAAVEARLHAGEIRCLGCGGELRPWGFARRRTLRDHGCPVALRPRRGRYRSCRVTHVLPTLALLRRLDVVAVIGEALHAHYVAGIIQEKVAEAAAVHPDTARRWLRRFAVNADDLDLGAGFAALAHRLDPSLAPLAPRARPPSTPSRPSAPRPPPPSSPRPRPPVVVCVGGDGARAVVQHELHCRGLPLVGRPTRSTGACALSA